MLALFVKRPGDGRVESVVTVDSHRFLLRFVAFAMRVDFDSLSQLCALFDIGPCPDFTAG